MAMVFPSDGGFWRGEIHCGDCGTILISKKRDTRPKDQRSHPPPRPDPYVGSCVAYYNGRRGNRCGWRLTWVWSWTPPEKAR